MTFQTNRVVAVLTPLLFAPLAGAISAYAARHFPGVKVDEGQVQAIFIAGSTIAFAKAALWLKGWQDWEKGSRLVPDDVAHDLALESAGTGVPAPEAHMPSFEDQPDNEPAEPELGSGLDPDWDEDLDPDAGLDDDEPFVSPDAPPTVGAGSV